MYVCRPFTCRFDEVVGSMIDLRKKRILLVHNYYQIHGGEDTVVAGEMKLLQEHGHFVLLYQRTNAELQRMNFIQKAGMIFAEIFNFRTYREAVRLIKENQIDIVHVHNTLHMISPSIFYAAFFCKVPVVQTVHNFRLQCPAGTFYRDGHICEACMTGGLRSAIRHCCYRNSRIQTILCVISMKIHRMLGTYKKINYICLTRFNRQKLLEMNQIGKKKYIDDNRVYIKPNFSYAAEKMQKGNGARQAYYIYAGRLDEMKGIRLLLQAWKEMGENAPELRIYGSGTMEQECKKYICMNELNSVKMAGMLPEKEILQQIASARALILPTQWYEGYPMTIAEAFSLHTPVITSDMGNAGDLVREGINGWKFQTNSYDSLKEKVMECQNSASTFIFHETEKGTLPEENYELLNRIYGDLKG